jgi:hypothetical protein
MVCFSLYCNSTLKRPHGFRFSKKVRLETLKPVGTLLSIMLMTVVLAVDSAAVQARDAGDKSSSRLVCIPLRDRSGGDTSRVLFCRRRKACVCVLNKSGIGGVRLVFGRHYKPAILEMQFKGFKNLESFALETACGKVQTDMKSCLTGHESCKFTGKSTKTFLAESRVRIVMKRLESGITVMIPARLILQKDDELLITWIDWYR